MAADPYDARLKPITEDESPVCGLKQCWKLKVMGDTSDYNPMSRDQS